MIKQNIKVALFVMFFLIGLWLVACAFIKIDVSTQAILNYTEAQTTIHIINKDANYIQSHDIDKVKVRYENQNFSAKIYYLSKDEQYTTYVMLSDIPFKEPGYLLSQTTITSLNIYKYLFKK